MNDQLPVSTLFTKILPQLLTLKNHLTRHVVDLNKCKPLLDKIDDAIKWVNEKKFFMNELPQEKLDEFNGLVRSVDDFLRENDLPLLPGESINTEGKE